MDNDYRICAIDGCFYPAKIGQRYRAKVGRPMMVKYRYKNCNLHYSDTVRRHNANRKPDRYTDNRGYVQLRIDGVRIAEHTYVMTQQLGRPLKKFESVHHINGVRNDNRIENLELWLAGIRYGQRAKDVICPHCTKPYIM